MKKTILLCFIHGFKGGEDTFGERSEFSRHLASLVGAALPRVNVRAVTYPRYDTRGDLHECVARFRDWLLERVIDLEVANGTPSPTVDPSVRVVLIGHSMGGIVAAEAALGLAFENPIASTSPLPSSPRSSRDGRDAAGDGRRTSRDSKGKGNGSGSKGNPSDRYGPGNELNTLMFPYIQGVLAFDTPYLGIAPGVVAHGAEGHYNKATAALAELSSLSGLLFGGGAAAAAASGNGNDSNRKKPAGALPAPPPASEKDKKDDGGGGGWGSWGKIAMYAGAAGAAVAAGGAAYASRQQLTEGWSWVGSHLEFVGCLARGEELRARVAGMARLGRELGVGFANLYTRLGRGAASRQVSMVGTVMGPQRTFCNLPKKQVQDVGLWVEAINDKADDEIAAHMGGFPLFSEAVL